MCQQRGVEAGDIMYHASTVDRQYKIRMCNDTQIIPMFWLYIVSAFTELRIFFSQTFTTANVLYWCCFELLY